MEEPVRQEHSIEPEDVIETEVLVVGGGASGCVAALSARRNGADVLLLERESYLGGTMTGVLVNSLNAFRSVTEDNPMVVEGIALEVFRTLLDMDGAHGTEDRKPVKEDHGQFTDPAIMVHALDELMMEANVDVLFNTFAFDAVVEDDEVVGVAIANKSGGQIVLADRVVDCSADADIAASAGAPFHHGREEDGRVHGGSLLMQVGGIDFDRLLEFMSADHDITPEELDRIEEEKQRLLGGNGPADTALTLEGEQTSGFGPHRPRDWEQMKADREAGRKVNFSVRGGPSGIGAKYEYDEAVPPEAKLDRAWIEFVKSGEVPPWLGAEDHLYPPPPSLGILGFGMFKHGKRRYDTMLTGVYEAWFDQTDQVEISEAIMYMRKVNKAYLTFLREHVGGFEDAYIINEAPAVGTRESRRILGEYVLTAEDLAEGRRFPDVIAKSGRPPSAHSVTGRWGEFIRGSLERPFDIPYRCLLPQGIENLLVAGRSISVSHIALGGIRDQANCMSTGEAAGAAAALSSRLDVAPRDLDVSLLQKRLLDQDALLFFDDEEEREQEVLQTTPLMDRLT